MNNPVLISESFERAASSLQHAMERFGGSSPLTWDVERFQQAVQEFTGAVNRLLEPPDMQQTRIGSACWYRVSDQQKWRGGTLRAWGTDFDQPDGTGEGFALFPVAVIEDDATKVCVSIYVTRVCFAAEPPT